MNNVLAIPEIDFVLDWSQTHKCTTVMGWQTFQHKWEKHVKVINLRSKQLNSCLIEKVQMLPGYILFINSDIWFMWYFVKLMPW